MMIKPGISELSKCVDSRYTLVTMEGKVGYVRSEAIKRAKAWEDEKAAAILSLNSNDDVQPEEVEVVEDDTEDNE